MGWIDRLDDPPLHVARGEYDLRLDSAGNVMGEALLEGRAVCDAQELHMALSPGPTLVEAALEGVRAPTTCVGDGVWCVRARLLRGEMHRLRVHYSGRLERAFMRGPNGDAWYELQFMTRWRPIIDLETPSTTRLTVTAPSTFTAASSFGLVDERRVGSEILRRWDTGQRRCGDFSAVVGEGRQETMCGECPQLRALCPAASAVTPSGLLAAADEAIGAYSRWWGTVPFSSITLASLPNCACGNCSREGLALFGQLTADPTVDRDAFLLVAHETAHMWWGLGVRFDEGSTLGYVEALASYAHERAGRERFGEAVFRERLQRIILPEARRAEAAAGTALLDCRYSTPASGALRQWKGTAVMLLLEARIGRRTMDSALHALLLAHSDAVATARDVRSAFAQAAGNSRTEVDGVFDAFIDRTTPIPIEAEAYGTHA